MKTKSVLNANTWRKKGFLEDDYTQPVQAEPQDIEVFRDTLEGLKQIHEDMNKRLEQTQNPAVQEFNQRLCDTLTDVENDLTQAIGENVQEINPYMRTQPEGQPPMEQPIEEPVEQDVDQPVDVSDEQVNEQPTEVDIPDEEVIDKDPEPEESVQDEAEDENQEKKQPWIKSALVDLPYKIDEKIPENHPPSKMKTNKKATEVVYEEEDPNSTLKVVRVGDKKVVLKEEGGPGSGREPGTRTKQYTFRPAKPAHPMSTKPWHQYKPLYKENQEEETVAPEEKKQPLERRKIPRPSGPTVGSILDLDNFSKSTAILPQMELANIQTKLSMKTFAKRN